MHIDGYLTTGWPSVKCQNKREQGLLGNWWPLLLRGWETEL